MTSPTAVHEPRERPAGPESDRRLEQFRAELAAMKLSEPSPSSDALLLRLGVALLIGGIVLGIVGYVLTSGSDSALDQRDGIVVALIGIPVALAGVALYVRHGLTQILRLWMARAIFDQQTRATDKDSA